MGCGFAIWLLLIGTPDSIRVIMVSKLTTNSVASISTIAVVACGNATIATVVASVVVSSIGVVSIVIATVAPLATNSNIAAATSALPTAFLVVVACNRQDCLC